ncbi:MAG: hypothetical protein ACE5RP_05070, partial [Nitrosopumilus sp.]
NNGSNGCDNSNSNSKACEKNPNSITTNLNIHVTPKDLSVNLAEGTCTIRVIDDGSYSDTWEILASGNMDGDGNYNTNIDVYDIPLQANCHTADGYCNSWEPFVMLEDEVLNLEIYAVCH